MTALSAVLMVLSAAWATEDGLHAYYPLSDGGDVVGGADATTPGGSNSPSYQAQTAMCGDAVDLDGNDFLVLPDATADPLQSWSISAWARTRSPTDWERVFDFGSPSSASGAVMVSLRHDRLGDAIGGTMHIDPVQVFDVSCGVSAVADTWYHVVYTYDSVAGGAFFLDGTLCGTVPTGFDLSGLQDSDLQLYLGRSNWSDPELDGWLDEVRIYDRGLDPIEVANLHAEPCGPWPDADGDLLLDVNDPCPDDPANDVDQDGFCGVVSIGDADCDDLEPAVNPGAVEVPGNAIDEDCDGIAEPLPGDTSDTAVENGTGDTGLPDPPVPTADTARPEPEDTAEPGGPGHTAVPEPGQTGDSGDSDVPDPNGPSRPPNTGCGCVAHPGGLSVGPPPSILLFLLASVAARRRPRR